MPLTPADIRNVAFSKPPIGKRGYSEEEVQKRAEARVKEAVADAGSSQSRPEELRIRAGGPLSGCNAEEPAFGKRAHNSLIIKRKSGYVDVTVNRSLAVVLHHPAP